MASADAVKAQLKGLMEQRSALEAEIAQRSARLEAAGVGMQAPLVDGEASPPFCHLFLLSSMRCSMDPLFA
jgi:hypothetical protein